MPGIDPSTLKPKVVTLQRNTAALLALLGGDRDDQLRFWEILKGITTPADFRLVEHQLATMQNAVDGAPPRPGTAGCGGCARRRMEGVARAVPAEDGPVGEAMASDVSLRCIADAVRMSLHLGIEASPFWGHVVVVDDSTGAASL